MVDLGNRMTREQLSGETRAQRILELEAQLDVLNHPRKPLAVRLFVVGSLLLVAWLGVDVDPSWEMLAVGILGAALVWGLGLVIRRFMLKTLDQSLRRELDELMTAPAITRPTYRRDVADLGEMEEQ